MQYIKLSLFRQPRNQPINSNIKDAAPAVPYLLGIPIKDFTVIASGDNKTGVVAQDLIEKYPELVHMDNDGYYMVDGMNTWKLVKAIQEQQEQIKQLTIYALALASRTKLALRDFKCAWFDENIYYEFFPLHAVYENQNKKF